MKNPGKKTIRQPQKLKNYVNWFEIPAYNFERAVNFYNEIYNIQMETSEANGYYIAYFPAKTTGIGGAVVSGEGCVPSNVGPLVYLNAGKDLDAVLARVENAGGQVIMPKTLISEEAGYFALFLDTEGNRLALHTT